MQALPNFCLFKIPNWISTVTEGMHACLPARGHLPTHITSFSENVCVRCNWQDLIAAGTTTTSLSLEWAMAELLRQPAVLERATQEVEQVVGRGGTVSESDIRNLPYLQAVVKETLRLHPPAPFLLPHYSSQATALGGYHIPAGTPLLVNVWALAKTLIFGRILTSSNPSGSSSPTAPPGIIMSRHFKEHIYVPLHLKCLSIGFLRHAMLLKQLESADNPCLTFALIKMFKTEQ